jgi:lipoate-protein ligase A
MLAAGSGRERPLLALWRPQGLAVVLGVAQRAERELNPGWEKNGIEVLRRQSGGGAVLLYPGVLCWEALAAPGDITGVPGEGGIKSAYSFLSRPLQLALAEMGVALDLAGISDLAFTTPAGERFKLAGTAQLRKRENILVHGALLVAADLEKMAEVLSPPSREPDYRQGRRHRDFCLNLQDALPHPSPGGDGDELIRKVAERVEVKARGENWEVVNLPARLSGKAAELESGKYQNSAWNLRGERPGIAR